METQVKAQFKAWTSHPMSWVCPVGRSGVLTLPVVGSDEFLGLGFAKLIGLVAQTLPEPS